MNPLKLSELSSILNRSESPCVSLYISGGSQGLWSPRTVLRYRQLLKLAEQKLLESVAAEAVDQWLSPLRYYSSLEAKVGQAETLCIFSSANFSGFYPVQQKIPDLCVVADSFHVTPIADFVNPMRTWFLVKLTKGGLQLYRGRASALESVVSFHIEGHPRTQFAESEHTEVQRFIRFSDEDHEKIDDFLAQYIDDEHSRYPLILSGTKTDTEAYLKATLHNFDQTVNFSERYRELDTSDLLKSVWPKVKELFELDKKISLAGLNHAQQTGRTVCGLDAVVSKLSAGHLKTLAVRLGKPEWGSIDWKTGTVLRQNHSQAHAALDCVYDDLVERAMTQGCKVVLCSEKDLPQDIRVIAVC